MANIVTKVEAGDRANANLFDVLREQLTYFRATLDDIKVTLANDRDETDKKISAVRVSLERQISAVAESMVDHRNAKNPHSEQAECRARDEAKDKRIKALETEVDSAKGTGRVLWPIFTGAAGAIGGILGGKLG